MSDPCKVKFEFTWKEVEEVPLSDYKEVFNILMDTIDRCGGASKLGLKKIQYNFGDRKDSITITVSKVKALSWSKFSETFMTELKKARYDMNSIKEFGRK